MNLGDLKGTLRTERLDDTVVPPQYDDELLNRAFNEAVRQVAIRKRLLQDRSTEECCVVDVAADQVEAPIHPRVLAIRSARWSTGRYPLRLTTLRRMDRDHPDWTTTPKDSEPRVLIVDAQEGHVLLWPTPSVAGTLQLAVWRVPLESEEMQHDDDEPVIPDTWHYDLLDWAEHLAYLSRDGELGDAARSEAAASRFAAKVGSLPTASAIRQWGVSPRNGQRAAFL